MGLFHKIIQKLKAGSWFPFYNGFYENIKLHPRMILLESRGGNALEGNILRIAQELSKEAYSQFTVLLSVKGAVQAEIGKKLCHYGVKGIGLVKTGTVRYYYYLAKAKYLVNDTSFPGRFVKKENQVYLNTWHGTPLKKMGTDNQKERYSMGNVMRNLLQADYLLFPNQYMEEKMTQAYHLDKLYQGAILREGYPRNSVFFSETARGNMRRKLNCQNKQVIVYLPTFRGNVERIDLEGQQRTVKNLLQQLDRFLTKDQRLYVRFHPLMGVELSAGEFEHISAVPGQYDINEFLNASDVLITDYSSVFYDYANTDKPIILFTEDEGEYQAERGIYEPLGQYPFMQAHSLEDLQKLLNHLDVTPRHSFRKRYCTYDCKEAAERICRHIFFGKKLCQEYRFSGDGKENILIYAGDLDKNGITTALLNMLSGLDLERFHYFISFRKSSLEQAPERLDRLPRECGLIPLASEMNMDLWTMVVQGVYLRWGIKLPFMQRRLDKSYNREWKKHYGGLQFRHVIHYNGYERYIIALYQRFHGERTIWVHNEMRREIAEKGNQNPFQLKEAYQEYDHVVVVSPDIYDSTLYISNRADNIVVIGNNHDYQEILHRACKEVEYDSDTEATVSIDTLKEVLDGPWVKFINIGRYSPEKGHERLIRAFERYWAKHKETYLIIIGGTGQLYRQTVELAKASEAGKYIILLKGMKNPMPILKKCQLFLLSSLYEGLGLVMLEADTLGVPVIACDVPGPSGFLKAHKGTLVADSEEGLYQGMIQFAKNEVPVMHVDYEKLNQENIRKCEQLL